MSSRARRDDSAATDSAAAVALIGLFAGDDLSSGYAHVGLAVEICRAVRPRTPRRLVATVYPEVDPCEVDDEARAVLEAGFALWNTLIEHAGSPRAPAPGVQAPRG